MTRPEALTRLDAMPVVAILRGVTAPEVGPIARALVDAGITTLEVPLSHPGAIDAVAALVEAVGTAALTGAGTVVHPDQVAAVASVGAGLVVSPHLDERVVAATRASGLVSMPGVATPTEAFRAVAAGADALKLFPGEAFTPALVKAWRVVLPRPVRLYPVGGVDVGSFAAWRAAGADGVGLGSALYRPGDDALTVATRARAVRAAWVAAAPHP